MEKSINKEIIDFLSENPQVRKILLGFSGGYDSMALFSILKNILKNFDVELHLAHVDHKMRQSSTKEALLLEKMAKKEKIPFHLKTLKNARVTSNLEMYYRIERYSFFKKIYEKYSFDLLVLAHQKDDLIETVLKRFFEGADLYNLKGIDKFSTLYNMDVYRPLLEYSKKDILNFLKSNSIEAIDDETNQNEKFLRGKMRKFLIPELSEKFGKNFSSNLILASKRAFDLSEYLKKKTRKFFKNICQGFLGAYIDLNDIDIEDIELKYLIKEISKENSFDVTRKMLERILFAYRENKRFCLKTKYFNIYFENNILFLIDKKKYNDFLEKFSGQKAVVLKEGRKIDFGSFQIEITEADRELLHSRGIYPSWRDIFKGRCNFLLPKNEYTLALPKINEYYFNKKVNVWFSEGKIPTFMRFFFPVIFRDGKMYFDVLSGKKRFPDEDTQSYYNIIIKIK